MYKVSRMWLHGSVKVYFEKHGINLLMDDLRFLEKHLRLLPPERQKKVMKEYFTIWKNTMAAKQNGENVNPRFEANIFMRMATELKNGLV